MNTSSVLRYRRDPLEVGTLSGQAKVRSPIRPHYRVGVRLLQLPLPPPPSPSLTVGLPSLDGVNGAYPVDRTEVANEVGWNLWPDGYRVHRQDRRSTLVQPVCLLALPISLFGSFGFTSLYVDSSLVFTLSILP